MRIILYVFHLFYFYCVCLYALIWISPDFSIFGSIDFMLGFFILNVFKYFPMSARMFTFRGQSFGGILQPCHIYLIY